MKTDFHGSGSAPQRTKAAYTAALLQGAALLGASIATPAFAAQDNSIDEIIVVSERGESDKTKMSRGTESLMKTAGNFGDPLQALTSLPGITFGGSDMDAPVVRGSGPQDNLFLIDDMQVGYLFHELSDSVLSATVVQSFDLKAAAFGAEYGDATGGVIGVSLRDPSGERLKGNLDLSMLKSGFLIEGPIGENTAFYVGGRYNTAHLFLTRFEGNHGGTTDKMPTSHDYTARLKWTGDSSSLTLTALGAQDIQEEEQNEGVISTVPLGNKTKRYFHTQGLKYEKSFENGGQLSATLSHTLDKNVYTYAGTRFEDREKNGFYTRVRYDQTIGNHDVSLGFNHSQIKGIYDYDTVLTYCDDFHPDCSFLTYYYANTRKDTFKETEIFAKDVFSLSDTLRLEVGAQLAKDHYLDQTFLDPRIGLFWDASEQSQFYAHFGRHHQRPDIDYILTLINTPKAQKNEAASHFLIGNRRDLGGDWYVKTEAYYKDNYLIQYATTPFETQADGKAYGVELLLAKRVQEDGLYGWLALSYGESTRKDRISGSKIEYRYNAPFSATLAMNYNFGHGWNLGGKFRVQSGDPYTPVDSVTLHPDNYFVFNYGESNSERTPTYHRLDIRLEKQSDYGFGHVTYYLDLLNVYNRENLSGRDFPWYLVSPTAGGGWQANPDDDTGIPFYAAIGVNIVF